MAFRRKIKPHIPYEKDYNFLLIEPEIDGKKLKEWVIRHTTCYVKDCKNLLIEGRFCGNDCKIIHQRFLANKMAKMKCFMYKGNKCLRCSTTKNLHFHHLDPNNKSYNIGKYYYTKSFEYLKPEMDKCILLCSECQKQI